MLALTTLLPLTLNVDISSVGSSSVKDAAAFFADSFWLSSTTFGEVGLATRERAQLARCVCDDFESRYGTSWAQPQQKSGSGTFFRSRLLLARDTEGAIVGLVGVEAGLYDAVAGTVLPRASAEATIRRELDAISWDTQEFERTAEVYQAGGLAALATELVPEYTTIGLMANLAVAPSARRTGLGKELCVCCELGCAEWGLPGMLLQVEEANDAARQLYEAIGYKTLKIDDNASALRVNPGETTFASALFNGGPSSSELLREEGATVVTMAKQVDAGPDELATSESAES